MAGDANSALQTYPDQSLYPVDSVPKVVERINNAFQRADQIQHSQGKSDTHWFAPIVVSAAAAAARVLLLAVLVWFGCLAQCVYWRLMFGALLLCPCVSASCAFSVAVSSCSRRQPTPLHPLTPASSPSSPLLTLPLFATG